MDELVGRLAIYCALGRDVRTFRKALLGHPTAESALADPSTSARVRAATTREFLDEAHEVADRAAADGLAFTWPGRPDFPEALRVTGCQLLCTTGALPAAEEEVFGGAAGAPALSVVGSREADAYGVEIAALLGRACARVSRGVVSGAAVGVDRAAHGAVLEAGGWTAVFLCTGLSVGLQRDAWARDALGTGRAWFASELLPEAAGAAWTFPDRNRLIAAMGRATVVVQAARKSGTLHTARFAREYGRSVFAVPGDLGMPQTEGVLDLLHGGTAVVLRHPLDLEGALGVRGLRAVEWPTARVRDHRSARAPVGGPVTELLTRRGALPAALIDAALGESASALLLEAELSGLVRRDGQGLYHLITG